MVLDRCFEKVAGRRLRQPHEKTEHEMESEMDSSNHDALQKVLQYRTFYHETLKPDLDNAVEERAKVLDDLGEYEQLRESIALQQKGGELGSAKRMIHLGADVYATAKVHDPQTICIYVGLGFYLQCTLDEGAHLVEDRIESLRRKKSRLDHSVANIKANIDLVLGGIEELKKMSE